MLKSLYFKIVLILLIFIIAVMSAVGAILMNGVTTYYLNEFTGQMEQCFSDDSLITPELKNAAESEDYASAMKNVLSDYGSMLGIDRYRNYYILNLNCEMLEGSDYELGSKINVTANLLSAVAGKGSNITSGGYDYADWAVRMSTADGECIVYIKDSLDEMRHLNSVLVKVVLLAMIVGILIAVLLSFFLAKSISSPLQSLTYGAQLVAAGEFSHEIEVKSADEIGVLAENFNYMRERLHTTLEEVDGEREKLDTILSCMRDAVVAFTSDGRLLHSNNSAGELFGEEIENGSLTVEKCFEILDLPLVTKEDSIKLTSPEAAAEITRDGFLFRDRLARGKVYDVSFAVFRLSAGDKPSTGCVLIIHDVTSRFELDESRREFVANVSHELRTPLTSIKGAAETIRMDDEMDTETRTYFLDMLLSESDRMSRIVSDLLVLSRLDNNRTKWNIETFDFRQSVRHLCEVMRGDLEKHRHTVTLGGDRELPKITADRQRIEQVVINIISNAVKYTPDGGRIDIRLRSDGGFIQLSVSDNGIGIPKEDISHLFERFYRVEKSRSTDAGGTGLGLAIAKEIVEAHGGQIAVESTLGKGTTVLIDLPVECRLVTE